MLIPYSEVDAANNNSSPIPQLAKAAKGAVCGAYHEYIDWYHSNINLASPAGHLLESFWNSVCPLEPPYSPPPNTPPPFTGGQCCGSYYKTFGFISFNGYAQSNTEQELQGTTLGKIEGIIVTSQPDANGQIQFRLKTTQCNGTSTLTTLLSASPSVNPAVGISRVVPFPGEPNNCGDLPTNKPPVLAPPPVINKNITINNNGNNYNVPVSFSPVFVTPTLNLQVKVPLNINASLNPQFNIKPTLNFNFGSGGVTVDSGEPDIINNLGDNINNVNNAVNNVANNVNNVNNTVNNINNTNNDNNKIVKDIQTKLACDPCKLLDDIKKKLNYVPIYKGFTLTNFQSITRDNLPNLGYLKIELVLLPLKGKIVEGNNADDTMYTGWLTFRKDGSNFEKLQITTANSTHLAPIGANGFSICCTNKARANCYYYIEDKN
jgi:hypothetical protein